MNLPRSFSEHPLVLLLLLGLGIRVLLAPWFSHINDFASWAMIIENYRGGETLYSVDGYYYMPPWGYLLIDMSLLMDLFSNMGFLVTRPIDGLFLSGVHFEDYLTQVEFNLYIKAPLFLIDVATAYAMCHLVSEMTGDTRKGVCAFAVWMLIPSTILSTAMCGMFDNLSALMMVLSIIFARSGRYALSGSALAIGAVVKFFPAVIFVPLVLYIMQRVGQGERVRPLVSFSGSFVLIGILLFIPQIINGELDRSFMFVTNRMIETGIATDPRIQFMLIAMAIAVILVMSFLVGRMIFSRTDDSDRAFFLSSALFLAVSICVSINPQYTVNIIPFVIVMWLVIGERLGKLLALLALGTSIRVLVYAPLMLASVAEYTSWVSMDSIAWWSDMIFHDALGHVVFEVIINLGHYLQILAIALILLVCVRSLVVISNGQHS